MRLQGKSEVKAKVQFKVEKVNRRILFFYLSVM